MKMRSFAAALIMTVLVWLLAAPMMSGCGDGPVSDSNTNSVENVKRENVKIQEAEVPPVQEAESSAFASMREIRTAVVEILGDNYWPDQELTKEELETETGITEDMYEDFFAEKQSIETDIDRMIIIKAKKDSIAEVETMLNEYRESLMVKYKDRPQELGKVEASRIETVDSYVSFVQLGADTTAAAKVGDEEVISLCQQENERAVDIIEKTLFDE
ncbi:DUF4358 domain-containing protein [Kineothrix sp. MB12-C1]|uniref:DUF4358 domain-containing protein n=1 Tax=Kineothrix sp. MB12-C1 TaxID=3070215 RepID=UPI0027D1FCFC|nr:DUF4358 domain-containing protein [Kineothrix sp. MB12-C1]WMC91136.1 DUF4358 domain-containing protein [Kineothrix sp. MB12-C1]